MKAQLFFLFLIAIAPFYICAQASSSTIEEVLSFPFNQPFSFYAHPAPDQVSGLSDLIVPSAGSYLIAGTFGMQYFHYNQSGTLLNTTPGGFGYVFHAQSSRYLLLGKGTFNKLEIAFLLYDKNDLKQPLYTIRKDGYSGRFAYVTENMIFFSSDQGFVTWELMPDGGATFRDKEETRIWLEAGHGTRYGYKSDIRTYFGMNVMGSSVGESYIQQADFAKGKLLGFVAGKTNMYEIGRDGKGIIYFYSSGPEDRFLPTATTGFYYFGIIDPWTKKVSFRALPVGRGVSPDQTKENFGYTGLPRAVDAAGNVYFFDVDIPKKRFVLNRLVNDWWDELGVKDRLVGVVNDNRLRLRDRANTQGAVLGYLYENEIALITEISDEKETISGVTSYWYKVQLPDGRNGWVFGSYLNLYK